MALAYDTVTFISDYGLDDEFVGIVHSVISSIAPGVKVIDITHNIAHYDVRAGGLALARNTPYLCPGIVLGIVDPGVGGMRRPVAVEVGDGSSVLVGPDNGLLAPAVAMCGGASRAVELTNGAFQLDAVGSTFAGRDVFAPAAAHLCNGVELDDLGELIDAGSLTPGLLPLSHGDSTGLQAEVLWVDRYGNAQLNLEADELSGLADVGDLVRMVFGDSVRTARRASYFGDLSVGEIGLVVDSYGLVAVAMDQGSAAPALGIHAGSQVRIEPLSDESGMGGGTSVDFTRSRREGPGENP